jgi:hypothetical protein
MERETAIDWFVNRVFGKNGLIIYAEIIQEAKEMEKEQIKFAYNDGAENMVAGKYKAMEDYYNENYSNENTSTKAD